MICTMTRPTISSNMAALAVTVPIRVAINCVVDRTVKVVPRLVALSAAPAAKACRELADNSFVRMKDKPIGAEMPVMATAREMRRFAFNDLIDVERPPFHLSEEAPSPAERGITIINQHSQAYIAQLLNSRFHPAIEPFCSGRAPENANEKLANKSTVQEPIKASIDYVQDQ